MNILEQLEQEHLAELRQMRETKAAEEKESNEKAVLTQTEIPDFAAGDTLRVSVLIREGARVRPQAYEGVCIARKGGDRLGASFTVRKISYGEGVERVFPLYCPSIQSITVVRRGRVRRAKLYYMRGRRGKSARIVEKTNYRPKRAKAES